MSSSLVLLSTVRASSAISFFYNKDFMTSHPDIVLEKKSSSPDEDKCVHDSKLLIPTLKDFFSKHPLIHPKTFLDDAALDTAQLYKNLLSGNTFGKDKHFTKAYIPLNARSGLEKQDYFINKNGIPCYPHNPFLPSFDSILRTTLISFAITYTFITCPFYLHPNTHYMPNNHDILQNPQSF